MMLDVTGRIALRMLGAGLLAAAVLLPTLRAEAQRGRRGTVVVLGEQPGAEVYVDAELVGTMPLEPVELEAGSHTIRVVRPGYTEYTDVFRIRPRQQTEVMVDLLAIGMSLSIVTDPEGGRVFVDGNFSGEAPLRIDLLEGDHELRVTRLGYHDAIRTVAAVAGQDETLELALEELPAEERRAIFEPQETEWYEEPLTWILVGGGAAALALGIVLIVVLTQDEDSQLDMFCAGNPSRLCPAFDSP